MIGRAAALGLLTASLLANAPGASATEKISLRVSPSVTRAPAIVRVIARIEPDASNRLLEISADSGEFYRSSQINLEGAQAPPLTEVALKDLPGGDYTVSAVLVDTMGRKSIAQRSVVVVSMLGER